jgi:hypothetical protein
MSQPFRLRIIDWLSFPQGVAALALGSGLARLRRAREISAESYVLSAVSDLEDR